MSYFKAKINQIGFWLGLCPRPRWGSLQRSPRLCSLIQGVLLLPTSKGREGEGSGDEGVRGIGVRGSPAVICPPPGSESLA